MRLPLRKEHPSILRERGQALIFMLSLLGVGVGLLTYAVTAEVTRIVKSDRAVRSTLKDAKDALTGYAVAHSAKPGALPCPDTDNDGIAEAVVANSCPSYIGRLPWRTLGIGDVRDAGGERLWYALSPNYREAATIQISSDTKGDRIVRSNSAALTLTTQAVAVVFAPGGILPGQVRDSAIAACSTTGTSVARNLCAANFLDTAATVNNASATGPYIAAQRSATFNDQLLVIQTRDFIPLVERRVASDLRQVLLDYRKTSSDAIGGGGCNCFPWPDSNNNGISDSGTNRGRIPLTAAPHGWGSTLTDPLTTITYTLPTLPAYVQANGWDMVIYYTVGRNALQNFGLAPTACTTCTGDPLLPPPQLLLGTLSIDTTIGYALILITPGSAGATRPSASWANYIDDATNSNSDDRYVTPTSKAFDRDRLFTVGDDIPPASCATNSKTLIYNAPCHTTGNNVKPVCARAASNLSVCTCSTSGNTMITTPCRNTLNPPACQTAVSQLQGCLS